MDNEVTNTSVSTEAPAAESTSTDNVGSVDNYGNDMAADNGSDNSTGDVRLKVDPQTGERILEFLDNNVADTESTEQTQTEQVVQNQEPTVNYYTDSELMQALASGNAMRERISPQQAQFIASQQQQYEAYQRARLQQEEQARQLAAQRQQAMANSISGVKSIAHSIALKQAGLSEADFNNIEFVDNSEQKKQIYNQVYEAAYANEAYKIASQNLAQQQRMQEFNSSMHEIGAFVRQEQATDPHCTEILDLMNSAMNKMPYEQAVKVQSTWNNIKKGSCTRQDLDVIRSYYDECKKQVYQKHANVSKIPQRTAVPKVEHSGQPNNSQQGTPFDFGKLRGMSQRDRDMAVQSFFASSI